MSLPVFSLCCPVLKKLLEMECTEIIEMECLWSSLANLQYPAIMNHDHIWFIWSLHLLGRRPFTQVDQCFVQHSAVSIRWLRHSNDTNAGAHGESLAANRGNRVADAISFGGGASINSICAWLCPNRQRLMQWAWTKHALLRRCEYFCTLWLGLNSCPNCCSIVTKCSISMMC
jgi:hypothetical protein